MTLTVDNVHAGYGRHVVLRGVTFELPPGKALAVLGASGTGKSTLARCLTGEVATTSGTITLNGTVISGLTPDALQRYRREDVGIVLETPQFIPELSLLENLALPLLALGKQRRSALDAAIAALRHLGLDELDNRRVTDLTRVELHRCAIARATVTPQLRLLVADSPTSTLDGHDAHAVATDLIATCHSREVPLVLTTDDPRVAQLCDYFLALGEDFPEPTVDEP